MRSSVIWAVVLLSSLTASLTLAETSPADLAAAGIVSENYEPSAALSRPFQGLPRDSVVTVWVYFIDKGPGLDVERELGLLEKRFSPRALARRARTRTGALLDWRDLPVSEQYVRRLEVQGFRTRAVSKWMNAASLRCRVGEIAGLYALPFVRTVKPVASFPRRDIIIEEAPPPHVKPGNTDGSRPSGSATSVSLVAEPGDLSFYGATYRQLDQIQVPTLHSEGHTGEGIFIGVLDTGFYRGHEALQNVNVVAEWDFINWDSVTANELDQDSYDQHNHGTLILGLLAGYKPETYSGAAFDADYALAKTEVVASETPVEEDYWVMGIEWLDSLGVDLVSSSLAYIDWYTYEDMNGDSAVTTIAADIAVSNGISVFNAMGNGGLTSYPYVMAPSDGDSVMSIGAVDSLGAYCLFSSRGPTYDGRIKPEVVAQGRSTYCVSPTSSTSYVRVNGTSCSTPLAAGACALVLQKNPTWTPMMLREAARATATQSASPDNNVGWGILQAHDASEHEIIAVAEGPGAPPSPQRTVITIQNEPNPFNPLTTIRIQVHGTEGSTDLSAVIFDIAGRRVRDFGRLELSGGYVALTWDGKSDSGTPLPSAVYMFRARTSHVSQTRKLLLLR